MSLIKKKIALPVQYREEPALECDGCGVVVSTERMFAIGWFRGVLRKEDGNGGVVDDFVCDYCPDCAPKVRRAQEQESKAIKAEKLAVAAETTGVL